MSRIQECAAGQLIVHRLSGLPSFCPQLPVRRFGLLGIFILSLAVSIVAASMAFAAPRSTAQPQAAHVAFAAPVQSALAKKKLYKKSGHQLEAVATFNVRAKVLSAATYRKGREALISPVDLALGWSKMASETMLSQVTVTQSNRFASMRYNPAGDIKASDIVHNSSNMHMIPASRSVKAALQKIKKGQVVEIEGYLVNIRHSDGWRWLTSTSRTDRGERRVRDPVGQGCQD